MASLYDLLSEYQGRCTRCHYLESPNAEDGHVTIDCPSGIIGPTSPFCTTFRSSILFPHGSACYYCAVPFAPPFNHPFHDPYPAPVDLSNCAYPDCIKVIAYLIYTHPGDRSIIFPRLGLPMTITLVAFSTWLGQVPPGGILNLYGLVVEYRSLRFAGRL
jgi:hypothetical protein